MIQEHLFPVKLCAKLGNKKNKLNIIGKNNKVIYADAIDFLNTYLNSTQNINDIMAYTPIINLKNYLDISITNKSLRTPYVFRRFCYERVLLTSTIKTEYTPILDDNLLPTGEMAGSYAAYKQSQLICNNSFTISTKDIVGEYANTEDIFMDSYECSSEIAVCVCIILHYFRLGVTIARCEKCGLYYPQHDKRMKLCPACNALKRSEVAKTAQGRETYKLNKLITDRLNLRIKNAEKQGRYQDVLKLKEQLDEYLNSRELYREDANLNGENSKQYRKYIKFLKEWDNKTTVRRKRNG